MSVKKIETQLKARELRTAGKSINEIASLLNCSKGSVSVWVRDIVLNEKQRENLATRRPAHNYGGISNRKQGKERRSKFQDSGRDIAKKINPNLHLIGCMLYWAEGGKSRNCAELGNTDVDMLLLWIQFLRECYNVPDEKFFIRWIAHTDIHTEEEIESFWTETLGIPGARVHKPEYNPKPRHDSTGTKKGKRPFGVCKVGVTDTETIQSIYGAIQEYVGIERPQWLDGEY